MENNQLMSWMCWIGWQWC